MVRESTQIAHKPTRSEWLQTINASIQVIKIILTSLLLTLSVLTQAQAACPKGAQPISPNSATCMTCVAGTYSPKGKKCTPANRGHYVARSGAQKETACPAGSYSASKGQAACTLALKGYFVAQTGATAQTKCANGTTTTQEGASSCQDAATTVKSGNKQCAQGVLAPDAKKNTWWVCWEEK